MLNFIVIFGREHQTNPKQGTFLFSGLKRIQIVFEQTHSMLGASLMTILADRYLAALFLMVILSSTSACDGDSSADLFGDESSTPDIIDRHKDSSDNGNFSSGLHETDLHSRGSLTDTQSENKDSLDADQKQRDSSDSRRVQLDDLSEQDINKLLTILNNRIKDENTSAESSLVKEVKQEAISDERIRNNPQVDRVFTYESQNTENGDQSKPGSSDYVEKLAEAMRGKGPQGSLYHPSPFGKDIKGRIGSLPFFDVLSISSDDTIQVTFYDKDIAFISNVDASDYVTGDRYHLDNTMLAMGNKIYTTVLGATQSAPLYRAYSDAEYKQAQEIVSAIRAKRRQAEEEAKKTKEAAAAKLRKYRKLVDLISGMKQNAERIDDFDRDIMIKVAKAVDNQIYTLQQDSDVWPNEWSAILHDLKHCNEMYLASGDDSKLLIDKLKEIMKRAEKLKPKLP